MIRSWALPALVIALTAACACLPAHHVHERAFWRQRDLWLLSLVGIGGAVAGLTGEYWLTPIALWFVCRWRSNVPLASLVVWIGVAAVWTLALIAIRTPVDRLLLGAALNIILIMQVVWAARQWYDKRGKPTAQAPRGTFGQRTLLGAYLALVWPLAPAWPPAVVAGIGLVLTSSWVAWAAALAGLIVLWPAVGLIASALVCLIVAGAIVDRPHAFNNLLNYGTLRGMSIDSIRQRGRTWATIVYMYAHPKIEIAYTILPSGRPARVEVWRQRLIAWFFGSGPTTLQYDLLRWDHRFKTDLINGYAHCEPIHMLYEYGLCGVAAIGLFVWRVGSGLSIGDPWSAAAVAGAVAAYGTITCRTPATGIPWLVVCAIVAGRV